MSELINKAKDLYIYGLPLVITEITHWGSNDKEFFHFRKFPTDKETRIVRLNNDTLYSLAWTQLANTPYIIHIPKITERYYLFPILDAYTNVIYSIGTRTPELSEGDYIFLYKDEPVPAGYENYRVLRSGDSLNSVLLRIETRGTDDYELVNKIQDSITIKPLYEDKVEAVPSGDGIFPAKYADEISTEEFFKLFAKLSKVNPIKDESVIKAFELFGYDAETGAFDYASLSGEQKSALEEGRTLAQKAIEKFSLIKESLSFSNGWVTVVKGFGTYGTNYVDRASVAWGGWGANLNADSVYSSASIDTSLQPLTNRNNYKLHINADEFPHAAVFWSITLYGETSKLPVPNKINRFTINSHDVNNGAVEKNTDGSLDIFISKDEPTAPKQRKNWLPAPANEERYSIVLRNYWPDEYTLSGKWNAPVITKI